MGIRLEVDLVLFRGYVMIHYKPMAGGVPVKPLAGTITIGGDVRKPRSPRDEWWMKRVAVLSDAIFARVPPDRSVQVDVEGKVLDFVTDKTGRVSNQRQSLSHFEVDAAARTIIVPVRSSFSRPIEADLRSGNAVSIPVDDLPKGLQRMIQSLLNTAERMAWEQLRSKVGVAGGTDSPSSDGSPIKVFISYRRGHQDFAAAISERLGNEGIVPWFDEWDLQAGDSIPGKIEEGLSDSVAFIPIVTSDYKEGRWATEELRTAIAKRVDTDYRIVPIMLDRCELPELIRHLKYVDFSDRNPQQFEANIGELIDGIYGLSVNPFR
jgi:hypothetical protein